MGDIMISLDLGAGKTVLRPGDVIHVKVRDLTIGAARLTPDYPMTIELRVAGK